MTPLVTVADKRARYRRRIVNRWRATGRDLGYGEVNVESLVTTFLGLASKPIPDVLDDDHLYRRADGRCVCETCGLEYLDHPESDHLEWLHVLCNKTFVKL